MRLHHILETLGLLATAGALATGCDRSDPQTTEVPSGQPATTTALPSEACLHADGCCGGHTPGDATCGEAGATASPAGDTTGEREPAAWTKTWTVAPGEMAEINLELAAGDTMVANFASDGGALKWNVHSHEGDNAVIHAQGDDVKGQPRHTAAKAGMYSFLWKNAGNKPVQLTIVLELGGTAKVHSTHPAE